MQILLSTSYLPSISIISASFGSEHVIIEGFETYSKQTLRNHCIIYGPNGPQMLTIPVYKVNGNHTMVKDIKISYSGQWQNIHWRSIETAYNNSPFFIFYRDHFEPFYNKRFDHLLEFNTELLKVIFNILGTKKNIGFTDQYFKQPAGMTDKRPLVKQKKGSGTFSFPEYQQTFHPKFGFLPNLSIIDLIFNLGPESTDFIQALSTVISP
jgi:hypothetical protein